MSYKCLDCGHIFEYGEEAVWSEFRGECFGVESYEKMDGCPLCRGDYEETIPCIVCGSEHLEDELNCSVCNECIDEYRSNFKECYKICKEEKTEIKISALIASLFDEADIEQILLEHISSNCPDIDCSKFIDEDIWWFGEMKAKGGDENENCTQK